MPNLIWLVNILTEKLDEELERNLAITEIAKMTAGYSANSTKVAVVMSKTRTDDLRWLRDYLQTQ